MRIIIITRSYFSIKLFLSYFLRLNNNIELMVLEYPKPVKLNKNKYSYFKRLDVTLYRIWRVILNKVKPKEDLGKLIIKVIKISDLNEILSHVQNFQPELIFLKNAPIIKSSILENINVKVLNGHSGFLPNYKGASCGLWPIVNKDTNVGVTIHEVTAVLDGGKILKRQVIPLNKIGKSIFYANDINYEQQKLLAVLLNDLIINDQDSLELLSQSIHQYYSLPGFSDYLKGYLNLVMGKFN